MVSPVDFICRDCGSDFELVAGGDPAADSPVTCPVCGSALVASDPASIWRWRPAKACVADRSGTIEEGG